MGGCLPASTLRHRRMLLEVRGAEDGSLARRRFEGASQRRLCLLIQVEAQLDVVLDAPAGVYLLVDLLVARGVLAALERERAVHRVIVSLIHRPAGCSGSHSGLPWSDLQIFGFARGEHTSSTADPLLLTLRLHSPDPSYVLASYARRAPKYSISSTSRPNLRTTLTADAKMVALTGTARSSRRPAVNKYLAASPATGSAMRQ